jgi:lactoylglutathione lyase
LLKRLDHVAVSVRDLDASIDFYSRHFHMDHYFTQPSPNPRLKAIAYLRGPEGVIELMHMPEHQMGGGFHFCFVSDNFDAEFQRLTGEGVPLKSPPHPTAARVPEETGWLRCVFSGPDGEEVELRGPGTQPS